jgi:hypothetical protein
MKIEGKDFGQFDGELIEKYASTTILPELTTSLHIMPPHISTPHFTSYSSTSLKMKVTASGEPETRFGYAIYRALATAKHALQPAGDTEGSAEFIRGERVVHDGYKLYIQKSNQMASPDRAW